MAPTEFGFTAFRAGGEGKAGWLPAFRLAPWREGVLGQLPSPGQAFGLDLSCLLVRTQVTDAGMKELAGLTQLQTLNLAYTEAADAGLKELAGLKQLRTLDLSDCNRVTDHASGRGRIRRRSSRRERRRRVQRANPKGRTTSGRVVLPRKEERGKES